MSKIPITAPRFPAFNCWNEFKKIKLPSKNVLFVSRFIRVLAGCAKNFSLSWIRSDQRSFPPGRVWSETTSNALWSHTCFERTSVWSMDTLVWSEVTFVSRVKVSLISYKDHIWFHTVHTWFLSTILAWNKEIIFDPCMITKKSYMILVWIPRIIHLFFKNLWPFVFFCFYSVGHHLYDSPALHCDPPKNPNVQNQLQNWALN